MNQVCKLPVSLYDIIRVLYKYLGIIQCWADALCPQHIPLAKEMILTVALLAKVVRESINGLKMFFFSFFFVPNLFSGSGYFMYSTCVNLFACEIVSYKRSSARSLTRTSFQSLSARTTVLLLFSTAPVS